MDSGNLLVIYEDNHLLAVDKPVGMPSQPDDSGDPSLDELAKDWLRHKYNKPGNVYIALLHRLDRPTSGVVLLARTEKAAGRMSDLFRRREIKKTYYAIVENASALPDSGNAEDMLEPAGSGGKPRKASLSWKILERLAKGRGLLEVDLHTGVKHQIRMQLALRGSPIVGDFRYGPRGAVARPDPVRDGRGILLHAGKAAFTHPVRKEPVEIAAPVPEFWRNYGEFHI